MIKRSIAAVALALMIVGSAGAAASARPNPVECLFYQTFAPREPGDCVFP